MIDPVLLRQDAQQVEAALKKRGFNFDATAYMALEAQRKTLQVEVETLQALRNARSKEIGQRKGKGEDATALMQEVAKSSEELKATNEVLDGVQAELKQLTLGLPNIPHASVPAGEKEADNVEIFKWGQPAEFDFAALDHVDLGEALQQLDFAAGVKIASSRFVVIKHQLARLHRALVQFMLDTHVNEHGYQEVYVPYLANSDSLTGTGQLPKFADDQFKTQGDDELYLIPTAEVPVTNLLRDEIVPVGELPLKFVAHTPCFRREAGSYGRDTRGMIRQHQFDKVELVQFVEPKDSYDALEALTLHAETILQKLELAYRKVVLCGGDLGFSAAKTYDLEVWLPGQSAYREISSCSNFEDFQARRLKARLRSGDQKPNLMHTLNGSGLAVGRTLVAVMENYQQADGSIVVPEVLRPYMGGLAKLNH